MNTTPQIADIIDVEVQYIRASPDEIAALEREFQAANPGWSMKLDQDGGKVSLTPPSHATAEQLQVLNPLINGQDISEWEIPEISAWLQDCCRKAGIIEGVTL